MIESLIVSACWLFAALVIFHAFLLFADFFEKILSETLPECQTV